MIDHRTAIWVRSDTSVPREQLVMFEINKSGQIVIVFFYCE